jgi:hypothetical protein
MRAFLRPAGALRGPVAVAALLVSSATAQITTQEEVVTDSVDVFSEPAERDGKSPGFAMLQSLVLPGLGQQYMGQQKRALTYFSAELLCLFGAIFCEQYSENLFGDARTMAWVNAGARGGSGADKAYWRDVGNYPDSYGYNREQELNRTPENKYVAPNLQWAWADTTLMNDYVGKRDEATDFHVASTFFIGAMVINRLISFIDIRVATLRGRTPRAVSRIHVDPRLDQRSGLMGMTVSGSF